MIAIVVVIAVAVAIGVILVDNSLVVLQSTSVIVGRFFSFSFNRLIVFY
jgi:hypothetical protein